MSIPAISVPSVRAPVVDPVSAANRWLGALCLASLMGCAPYWPAARRANASAGGPAFGALLRAVEVPENYQGFTVLRGEREGGQLFTTARMRDAVLRSAATVRRLAPGGLALRAGDFSAPTGGRISRHRSHRNGRDVDLLFYTLDAQSGASILAPGFVRYDASGLSRDAAHATRFDVTRNWLLVESLVQDSDAGVVWIFCSNALRALMLGWAQTHHRDPRWIERAERVLHQPGDSAPHDDHFHVRIACSSGERLSGCVDGGPLGWWMSGLAKPDAAPLDDSLLVDQTDPWRPTVVDEPAERPRRSHHGRSPHGHARPAQISRDPTQ
ncbi:MAG: penicillin-insensitive murein endopeptidase [Deltaproteobacteria bacterium]|nr:penicillin-insensitive murein endopeptidase [Deltaproteobacteria bacterium]